MSDSTGRPRSFWAGWIIAGILLLVAAVAGVYAANLKVQLNDVELRLVDAVNRLQGAEERLVAAAGESDAIRTNLAILSTPDTVDVKLSGKGTAPDAVGRAFVSPTKGLLFSATKLPPTLPGRTYQLWLLSKNGPVSIGVFRAAQDGTATAAFDMPADAPPASGYEVTDENDGGAPTPSSTLVLATR